MKQMCLVRKFCKYSFLANAVTPLYVASVIQLNQLLVILNFGYIFKKQSVFDLECWLYLEVSKGSKIKLKKDDKLNYYYYSERS